MVWLRRFSAGPGLVAVGRLGLDRAEAPHEPNSTCPSKGAFPLRTLEIFRQIELAEHT